MTNMVDEVLKINLMRINKVYGIFEPLKSTRRGASLARNRSITSTRCFL